MFLLIFPFDSTPPPIHPLDAGRWGKKCIKVPEIPSSPAACACSSLSRSNLCLPLSFPHSLKERHLTPCALSADYSSSHSLIVAGIILRPQMDLGSFSFSQTVAFSCSTSFPSTLRERKSVCSAALSVVGGGSEVAVTNEVLPRQVELRLQLTGQDEWESRRPTTSPKIDFLIFFSKNIFSLFFGLGARNTIPSPRTLQRLIGVGRLIGHLSAVGMLLPVLLHALIH